MRGRSPLLWISLGLVSVTVSLVLLSNALFHVAPDNMQQVFQYRKTLAETLAGQFSWLAQDGNVPAITEAMHVLVTRDPTIQSVALRHGVQEVIAQVGDHQSSWRLPPGDSSTLDQIRVPILSGSERWGTLELAFRPATAGGWRGWAQSAWVQFLTTVAGLGFVGYWVFMRRTLRQLDPSAVVPQRVRNALDVLTEGIVLLDPHGDIMLANRAFADRMGVEPASLLGRTLAQLPWAGDTTRPSGTFPWEEVLESRIPRVSIPMRMRAPDGSERVLVCNCSPVLDDREHVRGVLVSFDDVTELESTNHRLLAALDELKVSQQEVVKQNEALHTLATRDPLTGCLNRRAFFEQTAALTSAMGPAGGAVGCLMLDIDHFKSFNDRYGHAVGDQVLVAVAQTLRDSIRTDDVCARYGGEEFCVVVTNVSREVVLQTAERIRRNIEMDSGPSVKDPAGLRITASVGVAYSTTGADIQALLIQADQALYHAKQQGRNRVALYEVPRGQPVVVGADTTAQAA